MTQDYVKKFQDKEQYRFSYDNNGRWCENSKQPKYKASKIKNEEEEKTEIVV